MLFMCNSLLKNYNLSTGRNKRVRKWRIFISPAFGQNVCSTLIGMGYIRTSYFPSYFYLVAALSFPLAP